METKKRHWIVTVWLIFMIISNSYTGIYNIIFSDAVVKSYFTEISKGVIILEGILSLGIAFCGLMIFEWKKWGFWGIVGIDVLILIINIVTGTFAILSAVVVIGLIAILYGMLQIKKDNVSVWQNLE